MQHNQNNRRATRRAPTRVLFDALIATLVAGPLHAQEPEPRQSLIDQVEAKGRGNADFRYPEQIVGVHGVFKWISDQTGAFVVSKYAQPGNFRKYISSTGMNHDYNEARRESVEEAEHTLAADIALKTAQFRSAGFFRF